MKFLKRALVFAAVGVMATVMKVQTARADPPIHHTVWDPIDKVILCVGTPTDCNFSET